MGWLFTDLRARLRVFFPISRRLENDVFGAGRFLRSDVKAIAIPGREGKGNCDLLASPASHLVDHVMPLKKPPTAAGTAENTRCAAIVRVD